MDFEEIDAILLSQGGRIIHQIWFRLSRKSKNLFKKFRKYQKTWIINNPNWRYILWNEKMAKDFIKIRFPEYLELYESYKYDIQRIDVLRYFLLYFYGGLYADMDTENIIPIDQWREQFNKNIYFVETDNKALGTKISNLLIFSVPKHPFWKSLFIELAKHEKKPWYYSRHMEIMYTTGPAFLNKIYERYVHKYRLSVFPSNLFNPLCLGSDRVEFDKTKCLVVHYGEGSWESADSKFLIFFYLNWKILLFVIVVLLIPIVKSLI